MQSYNNILIDYNKDYTALLLNCYVKMKQKAKIADLIKKSENQIWAIPFSIFILQLKYVDNNLKLLIKLRIS